MPNDYSPRAKRNYLSLTNTDRLFWRNRVSDLVYVPKSEFERLESIAADKAAESALFANLCRINTLYMIMQAGSGHIGSSFSSLDIVSWLYLNEMSRDSEGAADIYFSSKGHDVPGLYSVLLALGVLPFDKIHQLRRRDGLPGHPDIHTPGIETNTGSLGMGISRAKGMLKAAALDEEEKRAYVLTGDGELQEGQFWESLVSAANTGLGQLTVIIDHNKIQSDTWVERVCDLGDLATKLQAYGWYVERIDGHDLAALESALERCHGINDRPQIIIADTIKGRGVSFMESSVMPNEMRLYPYHSGAPDAVEYGRAVDELVTKAQKAAQVLGMDSLETVEAPLPPRAAPAETAQHLVAAYGEALVAAAEHHPELVVLDADLALDCGLLEFEKRFPERFIECGIAEQDVVSQAGGLALKGKLPVAHSFACFLSTRPNEQIYNNASECTRVIYVGSLAGVLPAGPGHSHQSVRDIAALSGTPGLALVSPSCEAEVAMAVKHAVASAAGSAYLRLESIPVEIAYRMPESYSFKEGCGATLRAGDDAVLIGYGPTLLMQAWEAAEILSKEGIGLRVINLPWLNRVESEWLAEAVAGVPVLVTLDNHYIAGGQGQQVAAALWQCALSEPPEVYHLGLTEIPHCGTPAEVLAAHGLDAASIADTVRGAVQGG